MLRVEGGGKTEKKKGGQGYFRLAKGGAKLFVERSLGGQQFDHEVYFKRSPLAKMGKAVR